MTKQLQRTLLFVPLLFGFTACMTSAKLDRFVSEQYRDQVPKIEKRKNSTITVKSGMQSKWDDVSTTVAKTSKVLPLIVYWQYDYRHTCTLNPAVPVSSFASSLYSLAGKGLNQKLAGQQLELTVEQVPTAFAIVDKGHIIWVIYKISWDHIFVEPDASNLVVSYKLLQNDNTVKTGTITVENKARSKDIRFFQSWKSATSEHLADYNANLAAMTKTFVSRLMEEM